MLTLIAATLICTFGFQCCHRIANGKDAAAWIALIVLAIVWLVFTGHLAAVTLRIP